MGKGIWWSIKNGNYHFHDASNDPDTHRDGPNLLHFRFTTLDKLKERNDELWDKIIERLSHQLLISKFMISRGN